MENKITVPAGSRIEPKFRKDGKLDRRIFNKGQATKPASNHPWRSSFGSVENATRSGFVVRQATLTD